jgi:hypothetical protein
MQVQGLAEQGAAQLTLMVKRTQQKLQHAMQRQQRALTSSLVTTRRARRI